MTFAHHRRQIGTNEGYFVCRNVENFYSNFNVVGEYNHRFSKAALSHALESMIAGNPWLTYNIFPISDKLPKNYHNDYELRPVKTISLDKVVEYRKIARFDELTLETINGFKNNLSRDDAPFWQLCVFETDENQYVCGYFCHSLADGGTALQFQRDLVKHLERFQDETETVQVLFDYEKVAKDFPAILPARDLLTDLYIPGIFAKVRLWMEARAPTIFRWIQSILNFPRWLLGAEEKPLFSSYPVAKDLDSKFKIINFSPLEVKTMISFCRQNKITLTPFMLIVLLDCLEKLIYPHFPQQDGSIQYDSSNFMAISGRRYYPEFTNPFLYGVYVCGAPIRLNYINASTNEELVEHMQKFHHSTQEEIETRRGFKSMWQWGIVDISKTLHKKIGKRDRFTCTISNLGLAKDDPECSWKLVNAWFNLNTSIGYHFILNMVATETGGLNVVIPYLPKYDELQTSVGDKEAPTMELLVSKFRETCKLLVAQ